MSAGLIISLVALGVSLALGVLFVAFVNAGRRADDFADALTERDLPPHHLRQRAQ